MHSHTSTFLILSLSHLERVAAWGWAACRGYTTARSFSCYDGSRRIPHRQLPKSKLAPAFTFWLPLLEINKTSSTTSRYLTFCYCWMHRAVLSVVQVFPTSRDTWTQLGMATKIQQTLPTHKIPPTFKDQASFYLYDTNLLFIRNVWSCCYLLLYQVNLVMFSKQADTFARLEVNQ